MAELIAIDNGHGYNTPGKRVPDGSMREWEFNYAVAKYLKEELEYQGFKTYMVSDTKEDTALRDRTNKANKANANLLISIHANAAGNTWSTANGIETFAYKAKTIGDQVAQEVQKELILATKLRNRGVKYNNLHITRESKMPSILIECGFMDNKEEAKLLKQDGYRRTCAKAICKGICNFYKITYKEASPSTTYFRVVAGSYSNRANAEAQLKLLEEKGIKNSFIDIYKK